MQADHQCSACPRTDEERRAVPHPPDLEGAPMSDLRCGHQVHTHCLINRLYSGRLTATCAECQVTIVTEAEITFYRERYEDYGRDARQTVTTLWSDNEEFRKDVKEYKKLLGRSTTLHRMYSNDVKVIKNRFKENVLTSIAMINDQKRQATNEVNVLPSRKVSKRAEGLVIRKSNQIKRKWDISPWALRELNAVEGAPKIPRSMVYYRWHYSPKYIFRLKL
jgi:hypothetical protein